MENTTPKQSTLSTDDRIFKTPTMPYVHSNSGPMYCIFRIGRKYKAMTNIKGFVKHMERQKETENSDPEKIKLNKVIYGPEDIYQDTKEYLKDCRIYKNSTVGRELLLTFSNSFLQGITNSDFEQWIDLNIKWLKDTFGENFRYCILHLDETTPHLHALIVPKFWSEKRKAYTLQAYQYFNGIEKLRKLQDSYALSMQSKFKCLERGIRGSKAHHIPIRTFYTLINKDTSKLTREELEAKAKHEEMLKMKMKHMDKTLKSFQHHNRKSDEEKEKIIKENKELLQKIEELKKEKQLTAAESKDQKKTFKNIRIKINK